MPECTCIHESQCTRGPGCKTARPSEITARADVGLVERLQQEMAGEDCIRELEAENERLKGRDADADRLGELLGEMEKRLYNTRLVARRVLDLRSSYDADRGVDTKLVNNLQAREMLERIALASDENHEEGR